MGVLNVTPDSFSDGGDFFARDTALRRAEQMVAEGADIIDVGGESTRPGADAVSMQDERRRVVPVIEALARRLPVPVSVDTSKPEVMRAAADAGASLINDVRALRAPGALAAAVSLGLPVCLMHMQGEPRTMQESPTYGDVVAEVGNFLKARIAACLAAGLPGERLLLDPGFGFGKRLAHNLALLARLPELAEIGPPLLVGISRKSMLGAITGRPVAERLPAGLAAAVLAARSGARILRVHDVAPTVDALKVVAAVAAATAQAPAEQGEPG
ncbi:dihydropteroate synthase [uncultured Thiohalocapsa sp.]|uniref:dihydropteroate synthase n=1 Tax=uncultured Thiohalocapsa sp. TaxID=768990 RepID=UPI0025CCE27F|nr:dihydropteroate synthase [uncultured Thiohalocapsa sp.]